MIITHLPSRFNRRDGFSFLANQAPQRQSRPGRRTALPGSSRATGGRHPEKLLARPFGQKAGAADLCRREDRRSIFCYESLGAGVRISSGAPRSMKIGIFVRPALRCRSLPHAKLRQPAIDCDLALRDGRQSSDVAIVPLTPCQPACGSVMEAAQHPYGAKGWRYAQSELFRVFDADGHWIRAWLFGVEAPESARLSFGHPA